MISAKDLLAAALPWNHINLAMQQIAYCHTSLHTAGKSDCQPNQKYTNLRSSTSLVSPTPHMLLAPLVVLFPWGAKHASALTQASFGEAEYPRFTAMKCSQECCRLHSRIRTRPKLQMIQKNAAVISKLPKYYMLWKQSQKNQPRGLLRLALSAKHSLRHFAAFALQAAHFRSD